MSALPLLAWVESARATPLGEIVSSVGIRELFRVAQGVDHLEICEGVLCPVSVDETSPQIDFSSGRDVNRPLVSKRVHWNSASVESLRRQTYWASIINVGSEWDDLSGRGIGSHGPIDNDHNFGSWGSSVIFEPQMDFPRPSARRSDKFRFFYENIWSQLPVGSFRCILDQFLIRSPQSVSEYEKAGGSEEQSKGGDSSPPIKWNAKPSGLLFMLPGFLLYVIGLVICSGRRWLGFGIAAVGAAEAFGVIISPVFC